MATQLVVLKTNARGDLVGASNPMARHQDELVTQARALHAQGQPARAVAEQLGVNLTTMRHWLNARRRISPAVRIRMARRLVNG